MQSCDLLFWRRSRHDAFARVGQTFLIRFPRAGDGRALTATLSIRVFLTTTFTAMVRVDRSQFSFSIRNSHEPSLLNRHWPQAMGWSSALRNAPRKPG